MTLTPPSEQAPSETSPPEPAPLEGHVHADLDGFLKEDLNRIAADRPLETDEYHPPNDFYGQASVLRRYAGLPDRPLPIALEHGVRVDDGAWEKDLDTPLPALCVPTARRAEALRHGVAAGKRLRIEPIGFGTCYAADVVRRMHGPDPALADRPGGT
ncbi:MAG: hypothetical protein AAF907_06900, partial [Planctomycetota bacterium]